LSLYIYIYIYITIPKIYIDSNSLTIFQTRRELSLQKIQLRNKLGYRDDTKYQMNVGAGASNNYKRQG
jgi:hypothetical protein